MTRLPVGGVENQLLNVLKTYDKNKYVPLVCSLSEKGEIGEDIEKLGIEVICLRKLRHTFDLAIIKDLYRLMKDRGIDVVRTHQYHANFYGRIAAIIARVPCIVASVHNVYTRDRKIHRRMFNRILGKFTDKVVAVSNAVKKDIVHFDRIPEGNVEVIYNGVEAQIFMNKKRDEVRSALGMPSDSPVVGTTGRIKEQKGQKYLIEAVSTLIKDYPLIRLLIIGDGPLMGEMKRYADSLGINDNVIFLGTRRDVPDLLSAIDIFVLPSLWEGLGIALLEAMAAGKPVIATNIGPFREIVNTEEVGRLVPVKSSEAIASSIEFLLNDRSLLEEIGSAARKKVLTSFDINKTVDTYSSLFEEILRQKAV
jgi:glycosyltransferase involved in cell wall biosynthesis